MIPLISLITTQLSLFTIRDGIELSFFCSITYFFMRWLAHDRHNNLVLPFIGYCLLIGVSYGLELESIRFFLTLFAPVLFVCFIIVHERVLQKNYVSLHAPSGTKVKHTNWLDQLMRACLYAMNDGISLTGIIECSDSLQSVLTNATPIEANIRTGILEMLIKAPTFESKKILWINKEGTLIGINAQWSHPADQSFTDDTLQSIPLFKQDALLYTAKTDAIFFHADHLSHSFDIIVGKSMFESISAQTALRCIKTYLQQPSNNQKGDLYAAHISTPKQPRT